MRAQDGRGRQVPGLLGCTEFGARPQGPYGAGSNPSSCRVAWSAGPRTYETNAFASGIGGDIGGGDDARLGLRGPHLRQDGLHVVLVRDDGGNDAVQDAASVGDGVRGHRAGRLTGVLPDRDLGCGQDEVEAVVVQIGDRFDASRVAGRDDDCQALSGEDSRVSPSGAGFGRVRPLGPAGGCEGVCLRPLGRLGDEGPRPGDGAGDGQVRVCGLQVGRDVPEGSGEGGSGEDREVAASGGERNRFRRRTWAGRADSRLRGWVGSEQTITSWAATGAPATRPAKTAASATGTARSSPRRGRGCRRTWAANNLLRAGIEGVDAGILDI